MAEADEQTAAEQVAAEQIAEAMAAERESLTNECRADPARLARLLAPDFHEFGTSGGEFEYEGLAALVASWTDPAGEPIVVERHRGWLIADGVVMLKYTSAQHGRRSNRTSLWRRVAPGRWQIFYHQGTPTGSPRNGPA
ncbi:MAG TPA: nuclear transport factor 2 family protein [Actinophytocola sp.]|uniref:nuclear transport factor 2 family protein n=1 Tax=Actinophytocola sp. TaxID=1872138 RepID=UPI002F95839B